MLFDRSWCNRAGVEKVMGFCTGEDYQFLRHAPLFEEMLIESAFRSPSLVSVTNKNSAPDSHPSDRPGAPLEAFADGRRVPGPLGRLHQPRKRCC